MKKEPILALPSLIAKIFITSFLFLSIIAMIAGGILLYNKRQQLSLRDFRALLISWAFLVVITVVSLILIIDKLLTNKKGLRKEDHEDHEDYIKHEESAFGSSINIGKSDKAQEIYFSSDKLAEHEGPQLLTELRNPEALEELCIKGHSINKSGIYELIPEVAKLTKLKKLVLHFGAVTETQLLPCLPELYKLEKLEELTLIGLDTEGAGSVGLALSKFPRLTYLKIGAYIDATAIDAICSGLENPECKIEKCNINYGRLNDNQKRVNCAIAARVARASQPASNISDSEGLGLEALELSPVIY